MTTNHLKMRDRPNHKISNILSIPQQCTMSNIITMPWISCCHEHNNFSLQIEFEDDDILAQALLFFLAGFETSSTLLCFASHQLAVHPDIQNRLQEEITETLQEHGGKFTYDAVHNMKYLDMVLSGEKKQYCWIKMKLSMLFLYIHNKLIYFLIFHTTILITN
jgi:hypothetical protein